MKRIFLLILCPFCLPNPWADVILAIPRLTVGFWLATRFGWDKFPTPEWFVQDVAKLGFPIPFAFAWAAVLSEVIGGGCLVLGLCTRFSGFAIGATMLVAVFMQKTHAPLWEKLPALGCLWVALYAVVLGSGRFGLDRFLCRLRHEAA